MDTDLFKITSEDGVSLKLTGMASILRDQQPILEDFHARMVTRIDRTFELAGGPGSVEKGGYDPFRDITWEPLAAQAKRKDGRVIPAWGGVSKANGRGKVKGRLRDSGRRIQKTDALNQDTGRFRQRAATGYVHISGDRLVFGPGLNYSEAVEAIRSAVFIAESDSELLEKMLLNKLFDEEIGDE